MSARARRWSKSTDALNRCIRADIGSPKRPDQVPSSGTGVAVFGACAVSAGGDGSWAGMILATGHLVAVQNPVATGLRQSGSLRDTRGAPARNAPQRQRVPASGMMLA
jgi:hypothetical protein